MQKFFIFLLIGWIVSTCTYAQNNIVGIVTDQNTLEPLEASVISITHQSKTSITDKDGKFILKNVGSNSLITISNIGYITQQINIEPSGTTINIRLEKGRINLEDIVISTKLNSISTARALTNLDLNIKPVRSAQDYLGLYPGFL